MRVAVIGGGSWGTTLADMLAKQGHDVRLWVREQSLMAMIRSTRQNGWYLPGHDLAESLVATNDPAYACDGVELFVLTTPSQFLRKILTDFKPYVPKKAITVCASKGIELGTLKTMSEVVEDVLGGLKVRFAMLSGPSFAKEVLEEKPTAVALGCADKKLGRELQAALSAPYFRIYANQDYRGVELGGAVKNIIAIAAGVADGLGFGSNARAALITRGLAEMSRLGKAMGAKPETFMGLSGMGDLVLTCTGELSRNRQVGLRLGQGQKLLDVLGQMNMVAEGVKTAEAVWELGRKLKVELPISEGVYNVLYQGKDAALAVGELMGRSLKDE